MLQELKKRIPQKNILKTTYIPLSYMTFKTQWANYAGYQINPINMNFHIQTSLEIFDKNSADKIQSKKYVITDKKAHGRVR